MSDSSGVSDYVKSAFIERFLRDRANGDEFPVSHYLAVWPDHEELIAREFVALADSKRTQESELPPDQPTPVTAIFSEAEAANLDDRIGPYQLLRELGRGGQAVVWFAEDTRLGRKVALKLLRGLGPAPERTLARFRREAAITARLDHPGICTVHEVGFDGVPWIAMRYVEGRSLAEILRQAPSPGELATPRTGVEIDTILHLIERVARALHAAHDSGIVHRDIKPGNIMVTPDGEPVVLDFGIAAVDEVEGPALTMTGDRLGTPAYMAPEQVAPGRHVIDRRTDVHALGVILYEALTGDPPFSGPTFQELSRVILEQTPESPRALNPAVSYDLETVVTTALAKEPDRRYATALALADDLKRLRARQPIAARRVSRLGRTWLWSRRNPAAALLIAFLTLAVPSITGLAVWVAANKDEVARQRQADLDREIDDIMARGLTEVHHGDPDTADRLLAEALSKDPGAPTPTVARAWYFLEAGKGDAALEVLSRVEAAHRDDPAIVRLRRIAKTAVAGRQDWHASHEDLGLPTTALESFVVAQTWLRTAHDKTRAEWIADSAAASDYRRAAAACRESVLRAPEPRLIYYVELAHALFHLRESELSSSDVEEWVTLARVLTEHWPERYIAWHWAGRMLSRVDPVRAERFHRQAIALTRGTPAVDDRVGLATSLRARGQLDEAIEVIESLISDTSLRSARRVNGCLTAADIERSRGRLEEATAYFERASKLDPGDLRPRVDLALMSAQRGNLAQAEAQLLGVLQRGPGRAKWHHMLGFLRQSGGRNNEAVPAFEKAVALDAEEQRLGRPSLTPEERGGALAMVAGARAAGEDLAEAIRLYRRAVDAFPGRAHSWSSLGRCLSQDGRHGEALGAHAKAIALEPEVIDHVALMGFSAETAGAFGIANDCYRKALDCNPNPGQAQRLKGRLLGCLAKEARVVTTLGRRGEAALELMEERISIADTADTNHDLARFALERRASWTEEHRESARSSAERAVELAGPSGLRELESLALVLFELGHLDEAVSQQAHLVEGLRKGSARGLSLPDMERRLEIWRRLRSKASRGRPRDR